MIKLKLTVAEAHVVLRALARSNDVLAARGEREDIDVSSWVAQRLGRLVDPAYFGITGDDERAP